MFFNYLNIEKLVVEINIPLNSFAYITVIISSFLRIMLLYRVLTLKNIPIMIDRNLFFNTIVLHITQIFINLYIYTEVSSIANNRTILLFVEIGMIYYLLAIVPVCHLD